MTLPRLWNGFSEMGELSTCDRKGPARLTNVTMARAKLLNHTRDHGISAERLGDGISGDISEYWERLFDVETGYPTTA
jgi:hypothetical protein